ncbi:MAG: ABC transporter ATP-binding protein/permease [Anaerolineales bacterium]|nr:ABC transporter ATP-binding protein/permease [Anaerolineales bacterium]
MKIPLRQYWQLLVNYLKPQRLRVLILTVLLCSSIGLQLALPQIIRNFLDIAEAGGAVETLRKIAILFIIVAIIQQVVNVLATYVSENVSWTATNSLRADLAEHCLFLDLSFHNSRTPGEMIERIDGDVLGLANFFSQFVIQVLGNVFLLVGILVLLYRENAWVGLILSAFALVAFLILARFRDIAVPHWAAERQTSSELFGFLEERLAGTEDIRSNRAQAYVLNKFYQLMRALMRHSMKAAMMINVLFTSMMMLFAVGIAIAFAVGGYLYFTGIVTIGTVYLIFHYTTMIERPITSITRQLEDLQRAGAGVSRIQEILGINNKLQHSAVDDIGNQVHLSRTGKALALQFDGVTFGYDDSMTEDLAPSPPGNVDENNFEQNGIEYEEVDKIRVVENISFQLDPGKVLGLLGRTGSGKTTVTRLIFRFYDPDRGAIRITDDERGGKGYDLIDIRNIDLHDLRQQIGIVTQNIQLFHANVRDNLTFFNEHIHDEEILNVIDELGLTEWLLALPDGLDTELESEGGGLSAGEAQLLAFARIFLKNPSLVILDEASSRLDPSTEVLIEQAVDRLIRDRTAIIIAHRLGTVQRADNILILENGKMLEYGERTILARNPKSHFSQLLQTGMEEVLE